ncbi:MAG: hypothetical protein WBP85_12205 [Terracidiphilus sp.]
MISKADWYAFLIIALLYAVWLGEKVREIKKELKALREMMGPK